MGESGPLDVAVARHDDVLAALNAGRVDDALRLAVDAIEAATAAFGPDSPDLANVLLTCAIVQEEASNFEEAQRLAERAADVAASLANTDDHDLMALWVDVEVARARLSSTLGAFAESETRLAAALETAGRVLAPDDPAVLSIHNMRGITAKYSGRFDDAEQHYRRVQAVLEAGPDTDKVALAGLLHNLGGLAHSRGRVAEGLAHAQRGLQMRIDAVGPDHPDVARDLNAIGALHHDAGDNAAADDAYKRALKIFEQSLGPDHYEVAMTCANFAVSTAAAGDATGARRLYERALRILESTVGAQHPDVALVQHNLAVLLADQGELATALDLLNKADAALAQLPPEHPRRRDLHETIAELTSRDGEH